MFQESLGTRLALDKANKSLQELMWAAVNFLIEITQNNIIRDAGVYIASSLTLGVAWGRGYVYTPQAIFVSKIDH